LVSVGSDTAVVPQMHSGLLNEVARLVKTYEVTLCILYRLTYRPVIGLSSVRVFGRASKTFDRFLLEIWYYYDVS
jgi:hypothetical protein